MDNRPIGIFDSGVGGLSVLKRLEEKLPHERFLYFADNKNLPYGEKTKGQIISYVDHIVNLLMQHEVKAIVFACNTASSLAFSEVNRKYDVKMFHIIYPAAEEAALVTKNNRVAVFATKGTVQSNAYQSTIQEIDQRISVLQIACEEFVPLIESHQQESSRAKQCVKKYVQEMEDGRADTLILGCTHYPFIFPQIEQALTKPLKIINPAEFISKNCKKYLTANQLLANWEKEVQFFVTGSIEDFYSAAKWIYPLTIDKIKKVE